MKRKVSLNRLEIRNDDQDELEEIYWIPLISLNFSHLEEKSWNIFDVFAKVLTEFEVG